MVRRVLGRTFRLRLRPGRAMVGFGSKGLEDTHGEAGDEIVVPEATAAFLVRQRAVDIVEVIDPPTEPKPQ